jgi:hypothetical protein
MTDRQRAIEAFATIDAAGAVIDHIVGPDTGEDFHSKAHELAAAAFGLPWPLAGGDWMTNAGMVEMHARSAEIEADALENWDATDRIATLRAMAPRYRERGTVDLTFSR